MSNRFCRNLALSLALLAGCGYSPHYPSAHDAALQKLDAPVTADAGREVGDSSQDMGSTDLARDSGAMKDVVPEGDSAGTGGSVGQDGGPDTTGAAGAGGSTGLAGTTSTGDSTAAGGTTGGATSSLGTSVGGSTTPFFGSTAQPDAAPDLPPDLPPDLSQDLPVGPPPCPKPEAPVNGNVTATSWAVGAVATFSCNTGYLLTGPDRQTCGTDSQWSPAAPTCRPVDCGALLAPEHGSLVSPATTYNSVANVSCSQGFTLSGSAQRTCQADGTWSGTAGTCSPTLFTFTLKLAGSGLGTVLIQPTTPLNCTTDCVGKIAINTAVTLTPTADAGQSFVGWDSPACKGKSTCIFTMTGDTVVSAIFSPPPNIVFVTSTEHTGNLGGLTGADDICMARAAAAGLNGTYKAWLSTATVSAKSRLGNASGWARPDGKPVLSLLSDLQADKVLYPPCLDESGNNLGAAWTRTGTAADGAKPTDALYMTCGDYTSAVDDASKYVMAGFASSDSSGFTANNMIGCSLLTHILCFGINRQAFVAPDPTTPGRRAFTTSADWTPGGGLASADALCQKEAGEAGLTGTFKALLAPTGATAASRFTGSEAWHRMDGLPLATTADDFLSGSTFDVAPNMTAKGQYLNSVTIWTGAATPATAGADTSNCNNWQSSTSTSEPSMGECDSTATRRFFGMGTPIRCGGLARLVCLQN